MTAENKLHPRSNMHCDAGSRRMTAIVAEYPYGLSWRLQLLVRLIGVPKSSEPNIGSTSGDQLSHFEKFWLSPLSAHV